ncbi:sensor histidine kinase [Plantactinospora solaniradicis]|uniref:histidine kinase n=1 Tax=Plantactinospora solaniradicis TaxID=1723736 RepID=A0ABW1KRT9_9ACTN
MMRRHLLAAAVLTADTAMLAGRHGADLPVWAIPAYALVVALVIALCRRAPLAALAVALVLTPVTGTAYVLLLWVAYHAGREVVSRSGTAMLTGTVLGALTVQLVGLPARPGAVSSLLATYLVFVALPVLVGRYLAQQERLVSTLDRHNRQLRRERELVAEQEQLRERLRIARDMHDSLGHRLSLVSVQAAALEVSALPPPQRQAVQHLARATRDAMDELYGLVGALRSERGTAQRSPGVESIDTLVTRFRTAGVPVTLRRSGTPRPLAPAAGQAAYRVVQEGLTNAAKHAPGRAVTVRVTWEPDALLITLVNPLPDGAAPSGDGSSPSDPAVAAGHGLAGLRERMVPVGGFVEHGPSGDGWRLVAMLPATAGLADLPEWEPAGLTGFPEPEPVPAGRIRTLGLGLATASVMFLLLPGSMLLGIG